MFLFKWLIRGVVVLLVLAAAGYAFAEYKARGIAEERIEEEVRAVAPTSNPQASVGGGLLIYNLVRTGKVPRVEITLTQVDMGPFVAASVVATFNDIEVDRQTALKDRKVKVNKIANLRLTFTVTSEEMSRTLPQGFTVELRPGEARLLGPGVDIKGTFKTETASSVAFVPSTPLPRGVPTPRYGIDVPYASCIQEIVIRQDLVEMTCSIDNPPTSFKP